MNLKGGLQKDGTELYNEEGPNNEKPAAKNRHCEEHTLKILITFTNCMMNLVVITRTLKKL